MTVIPALRSQGAAQVPTPPAKTEPGPRAPVATDARPVSVPICLYATPQIAASSTGIPTRLAERDESDHPAAEARMAAEAARKAYIKASIAAGLSPLPLP